MGGLPVLAQGARRDRHLPPPLVPRPRPRRGRLRRRRKVVPVRARQPLLRLLPHRCSVGGGKEGRYNHIPSF
uniref:Uncharacterized protein n=1 Tax=Arundo donax TaxID=35708 RepID=A0A0A9DZ40_ARUDO